MIVHTGQSILEQKAKVKKDLVKINCRRTWAILIVFVKFSLLNNDLHVEWKQSRQLNVTQLKGKTTADQKAQLRCQLRQLAYLGQSVKLTIYN